MYEIFSENWELFVPVIVSIAAFIAVFLKAPEADSSTIYRLIYNIVNYLAFNFGKAKNADEVQEIQNINS